MASIEPVPGGGPNRWRVRWRDSQGRARSKRVPTKRDALYLKGQIERQKALGENWDLDRGTELLHEFVTERWWRSYAVPHLAPSTRKVRRQHWNTYLLPEIGDVRLRDVSLEHIDRVAAALEARQLAPATRRTILLTLHGILERAVEWQRIPANPMRRYRLPARIRQRSIRPLPPAAIEAIRAELDQRGAMVVSLMAYAGLRPRELRGITWEDLGERRLVVREQIAKTGHRRTVPLLAPLADDLRAWNLAQGRPSTGLVMPATRRGPRHGYQWSADAFARWTQQVFKPAAARAGYPCVPYDLRHSFVSLLIQSGMQILEVARIAGHLPEVTLRTYGHLFEEYDPAERVDPEAEIAAARKVGVRSVSAEEQEPLDQAGFRP